MRGKPISSGNDLTISRITPADAGKTWKSKYEKEHSEDHPRGCGENLGQLRLDTSILGSPPRMRGKPRPRQGHGTGQGITPADAGKTHYAKQGYSEEEDHPRGCGENTAPKTAWN